jgi:alkanesulfonate monooxygenase SsuD/methylene tetrahydromethanopterin reductase-like flavin-dependent oxidoreductase (luciferase family)
MRFSMRFDLRNPAFAGTSVADRYAAAVDMAEWADELGCTSIIVAEHHGVKDGYIPSPAMIIAAMAARTQRVQFSVGALIAPFHDPLRTAEDFCVLDNITRGRIDVIVAAGYVQEEFAMFGVPMRERATRVTEMVTVLKSAFTGKPFEYRGRMVHITPEPFRPGGPRVLMGGSSEAAARRAARIADGFVPSLPELSAFYRDEMLRLGKPDPGTYIASDSRTIALSRDPEKAWDLMAPYFFHDLNSYGAWRAQTNKPGPYHSAENMDQLRAGGMYTVISPAQMITQLKAMPTPFMLLHPLCGGMPVDLAWESLRLFENEVLPALR